MIKWVLVAAMPFAVALGTEFGRRKQETAGRIFSFVPRRVHLPLSILIGASVVLFLEAARVSISDPSPFHLWMLILSGVASQVGQVAMSAAELWYAKRRLEGRGVVA